MQILSIQVLQQLALISLIILSIYLIYGWPFVKNIMFPLGFLFMAVPMGEGLINPMMELTAIFVKIALELTGIPVVGEGLFFSIPSGSWAIVEGCSGVRYLIASITLGLLYGYLSYQQTWRRVAMLGLAILLPIVGNWLRAYMIVMIGHLSDNKLATGVDHLIYGWVFFGILMMFMFWIGSFMMEPLPEPKEKVADSSHKNYPQLAISFVVIMALLLVWPWIAQQQQVKAQQIAQKQWLMADINRQAPWSHSAKFSNWQPLYQNTDYELNNTFRNGRQKVGLFIEYYASQRADAELINTQNMLMRQKNRIWQQNWQRKKQVQVADQQFEVYESQLNSRQQRLLVWHWYWVNDQYTSNDYVAKLLQVLSNITGAAPQSAAVIIYTEILPGQDSTEVLQNFLQAHEQQILTGLRQVLAL